MNECLTIDDEDEEDHRWFFSCLDPDHGFRKADSGKQG